MPRLNVQQILADLNSTWWIDNQQFIGGALWQSATIYYQDTIGQWHSYTSTGVCPENPDYSIDPDTRTNYVQALMRDTANYLANGQCASGITNVQPREWQPVAIYPS
jgi:hypothetical protein